LENDFAVIDQRRVSYYHPWNLSLVYLCHNLRVLYHTILHLPLIPRTCWRKAVENHCLRSHWVI